MHYLLWISGLLAALIAVGLVYQGLGARRDRRRYTHEGQWIDIGSGRRHYLVQKGADLEKVVLSRAVRWHIDNRILVYGNKTVVFD